MGLGPWPGTAWPRVRCPSPPPATPRPPGPGVLVPSGRLRLRRGLVRVQCPAEWAAGAALGAHTCALPAPCACDLGGQGAVARPQGLSPAAVWPRHALPVSGVRSALWSKARPSAWGPAVSRLRRGLPAPVSLGTGASGRQGRRDGGGCPQPRVAGGACACAPPALAWADVGFGVISLLGRRRPSVRSAAWAPFGNAPLSCCSVCAPQKPRAGVCVACRHTQWLVR